MKDDDNEAGMRVSRRQVIGNLGALAAMSALGPSAAHAVDAPPAAESLTNPVGLYPKPPFPHQVQAPPLERAPACVRKYALDGVLTRMHTCCRWCAAVAADELATNGGGG